MTEAVVETRTGSVVKAAVEEGTGTAGVAVATPTAGAGRLERGMLGLGGLLGVGVGMVLVL